MKKFIMVLCWSVSAATIIYAAANPACGVVWQGPWSVLALAAIGLGLIRHFRPATPRPTTVPDDAA
jgi:hypothetical protein